MAKFRRPTIDTRRDHGESGDKFCVTITLHDLRRKRRWFYSEPLTHRTLDLWIDVRMRTDCATDFANTNTLLGLGQALDGATELVIHERQLQSKTDWLGVHAVTAADHWRQFVTTRLVCDYASKGFKIIEKDLAR